MIKLRNRLLAAAAVLGIGLSSQALASGVFTVTPTGISPLISPVLNPTFQADDVTMNTSELLQAVSPNMMVGSGWGDITAFNLAGNPQAPVGFPGFFDMYVTFQLEATNESGTMGAAGSTQYLDFLNIQVWGNLGHADTYNPANAATDTQATVSSSSTPVELATGSLIPGEDSAGFDAQGGAYLNATTSFALTAAGMNVFTGPVPFFTLAFSEFNNTKPGVAYGCPAGGVGPDTCISINHASGSVDFSNVPEPASLAIFGLGLAGLAFLRRKSV